MGVAREAVLSVYVDGGGSCVELCAHECACVIGAEDNLICCSQARSSILLRQCLLPAWNSPSRVGRQISIILAQRIDYRCAPYLIIFLKHELGGMVRGF